MFGNLQEKLAEAFKKFKNKGKLTEKDVREGMRAVKLALLEADVNFKVVRSFINTVTERAVGAEVLESLVPAQQVIKIVNEELTALMGSTVSKIQIAPKPPTIIMMVGLQGAGKTTHTAKLAALFKKDGKRPMLAACDIYRPAAIKQLQVVGEAVGVPVYAEENTKNAVKIAQNALKECQRQGCDMLFIDTAGRLHIDEDMMQELLDIKNTLEPAEILLTVDAMTGQDAVNVAESFNGLLDVTGVVMTKMDGDTRGGAALSIKHVTGKPIKFIGTGEKLDAIEPFYPDRMASRILGMGDMLSLIEKAQQSFDEKKAQELEEKLRKSRFTLTDYLEQFGQLKQMGSLDSLMGMLPGVKPGALKDAKVDEKAIDRMQAIILSMTPAEREKPDIINSSRKKRIAAGAGTTVEEVNKLLKQFDQTNKLMKQLAGGKKFGKFGKMPF
ncbi:MAG: signal recognition particle protein [Ruminococcaceae bacterium]|nr:signal recognition particle protein [Oscillospiraceae bacterium]